MLSDEKLNEILRYLGASGAEDARLSDQIASSYARLKDTAPPRYRYRCFPLIREGEGLIVQGSALPPLTDHCSKVMLSECSRAILFCCTLGSGFERALRAASVRSMEQAVILDACGSALVEEGCDALEAELKAAFPGTYLTDRFSPGYGDLPLSLQKEICQTLDLTRALGVTVSAQYVMNPMKTVTAMIGLSDRPQRARIRGCRFCSLRGSCIYRKGGLHCAD